MPKGAIVRGILENFIKDELLKRGYQPVYTPHIGKIELYQTSGHYPYYKDSQFPPLKMLSDAAAKELLDGLDRRRRSTTTTQTHPAGRRPASPSDCPMRRPTGRRPAGPGRRRSYFELSTAERIGYLEQSCDVRGIPAQADELPAPHPDLRRAAAELPRPAASAWRSSARSTATSSPAS